MEDFDLPIEDLQRELNRAIQDLAKSKDLDQRIKLSEIIKNLSAAMGTFFNFASDMMMRDDMGYSADDDYDEF